MTILDELLVAIGMRDDGLTDGAQGVADEVERSLAGIDGAGAGAAIGDDLLDGISGTVTAGDLDAEIERLLSGADDAARAAGDDAGQALGDGLADGAQQGADQAAQATEQSFANMDLTMAGVAAAGVFVAGVMSAMDLSAVQTRLENQLGLAQDEAERAGRVVADVFSAGFGESIDEVGQAVAGVAGAVGGLSEVTDAELQSMTKAALGLARTFDFDLAEATQAAGALMKSGLAADGQEAFDLLTAGAQALPLALQAELPAVTAEYTEFFAQLGATGPQMMGVLAAAAEDPLFQIDRLGDAVKEFTLVMAEGAEGTAGAVEDLGLDLADLQELIDSGRGTEAFDQVSQALAEVEDQTERTRIQAELMGGPGEDVGNTLMAVADAGGLAGIELADAAGAAEQMATSMEASSAQQMDAALRTLQTTLGTALLPAVQAVSQFIAQNQSVMQIAVPVILALAAGLAIAATAQWAMNSATLAWPGTWIILGIVALVAAIVAIATKTTWFQDAFKAAMSGIGAAWDWVWNKIDQGIKFLTDLFMNWTGPGLLIQHWDSITAAVGGSIDWMEDKVGAGIGWVQDKFDTLSEIPGKVTGFFSGLGSDIGGAARDGFRSAMNSVIDGWNSISFTVGAVDWPGPGSFGGFTISTPDIPRLADGGVAVGPTLALVGEGKEREAILPLSRLDSMLASVAPAVRSVGAEARPSRLVIDVTGADEGMKELLRRIIKDEGGLDALTE